MKHIYKHIGILALLFALTMSSCTDGLSDDFKVINTDPNNAMVGRPASLWAPAVYATVTNNLNRSKAINNELMQVTVTNNSTNDIHRYDIRATYSAAPWNNWYVQLGNFRAMYKLAKEEDDPLFMGISLVLDAWTMTLITDTYGHVPNTEAARGLEGILQPKFDHQKDIYLSIMEKLEEANRLLGGSQDAVNNPSYGLTKDDVMDPIFRNFTIPAQKIDKWRRFGNSLYLRTLMRLTLKVDDMDIDIRTRISKILDSGAANYPMMEKREDSAILEFTSELPYQSPWYNSTDYDFRGSTGLADFFVDNLNTNLKIQDPRLKVWAGEASLGAFWGMQSGYEPGNQPDPGSKLLYELRNNSNLGNIMNCAETQFLIAEAAVRGWTTKNAKEYYEKGIENAIYMWVDTIGVKDDVKFSKVKFDEFIDQDAIKWNEAEGSDFKIEKIMLQKYYALFFTDFQQWFEYKRSGYPIIERGPGIPLGRNMPNRLVYPVYIQSVNKENYHAGIDLINGDGNNQGDNIASKLWWQIR